MTELIMPLKVREDKALLALLSMLQTQKQMRFSELFKKIGIRNLYLLLNRMKDIETALQGNYAGVKLLEVKKQKVGKRKFVTYLEAHPHIDILPVSDSQAMVRFTEVCKNGAEQSC